MEKTDGMNFKETEDGSFVPIFNAYMSKDKTNETISFMHNTTYLTGFFRRRKIQKKIFVEITPFYLNICDHSSAVLGNLKWYSRPIVRFDKTESQFLIYTQDFNVPDISLTAYHEYIVVQYNTLLVNIADSLKPWDLSKRPVYKMTRHTDGNERNYIVKKFNLMYKAFRLKYPSLLRDIGVNLSTSH